MAINRTKSSIEADPDDAARNADIENELSSKYHVKWTYVTGVPAANFDLDRSLHNQARFEATDGKTVELYAEAVRRGDVFPAVLAYKSKSRGRYVIIDGNHRLSAHIRADKPELSVYEIDSSTDPRTIALMTFAFNTRHGRPTSEDERTTQAVYLVENGSSVEHAAAAVSIPSRVLKRALARAASDQRADEVRIPRNEWDTLSSTVKARLLNVSTDEGFHDAAKLAYAAKLDATECFELVALLNEGKNKSARRQQAIVKQQYAVHNDRIQGIGGGLLATRDRKSMSAKSRLSVLIGQTLALPGDDAQIVNAYATGERPAAARQLTEAGEHLLRLAKALSDES